MALKDEPHGHVCDRKAHDISETSYANYANYARGQASSEGRKKAGQAGYWPASDSTVAAALAMLLILCLRVPILLRMALEFSPCKTTSRFWYSCPKILSFCLPE